MAHILVVDDDELILSTLRIVLTKAGHTVRIATGRNTLAMYDAARPELLIAGALAAECGTLNMISAFHAKDPDLPIIAMSHIDPSQNFKWLQRTHKAGASDLLPKPFTKGQLIATVNRCLKPLPQ